VILYIPKSLRDSRHFVFPAEHPRSFLSFPSQSNLLDLPTVVGILLACHHLIVTRKPSPSSARGYDFKMTFKCGFCLEAEPKLRLKRAVDASRFAISTKSCCVHCFQGLVQNGHSQEKRCAALCRCTASLGLEPSFPQTFAKFAEARPAHSGFARASRAAPRISQRLVPIKTSR
jgi:hypothetical protein